MVKGLFRIVSHLLHQEQPIIDNQPLKSGQNKGVVEVIEDRPPTSIPKSESVIVIDHSTGKVVSETASKSRITETSSLTVEVKTNRKIPYELPTDIAKLAAKNAAFLKGIRAIQQLNLEHGDFLDAIEDLRKKYYKEYNIPTQKKLR